MDPDHKENVSQLPKLAGFKRPGNFKPPAFTRPRPAAEITATAPAQSSNPSSSGQLEAQAATSARPRPAPATQAPAPAQSSQAESYYFVVLFTKLSTKKLRKNKAFADGVLEVKLPGHKAVLHDSEGKVVASTMLRGYGHPSTLGNGSEILIGSWEVEVDAPLPGDQFRSGEAFLKPCPTHTLTASDAAPHASSLPDTVSGAPNVSLRPGGVPFRRLASNINIVDGSNGAAAQQQPRAPFQVHDPHAPGAVILNKSQWEAGKDASTGVSTVSAVVLDPFLMRHLRPHQVAGVKFLYECVMGLRDPAHLGAILADGMGLGKTLQTIALLWTLLKQGPTGRPAVAKALVVTPSSLTRNWAQEIRKWLGDERLRTIIIEPGAAGAQQVLDFKGGTVARVAIVSYETLRLHADALAGCVGVLVADEGHRLKSAAGNKTISALLALKCQRRILLTGTPIQNNLSEFYAMCDFVCGDVLGSLAVFNRVFGGPIARSRERGASPDDIALGAARSEELARRVEAFVLRRGSEINAAHLPPMSLFVVFCRPTPVQLRALSDVLGSGSVRRLLSASGSDFGDQALSILTMLRKICNHPALHAPAPGEGDGAKSLMNDNAACDGKAPGSVDFAQSGKLAVLAVLLEHIIGAGDRCVVVSQSTAMLDLVSAMCAGKGYSTVRIDGSTDVSKRQDVVNSFNSYNVGQVFLLSTTAGGAGLNLTGANRLVLCDSHWNPAMDAQAMSRVWRDGQRKPCHIYRLITTGTLEEKIYQRQRAKGDIASMTVGQGGATGTGGVGKQLSSKNGQFSKEELRQLFTLRTDTACDTSDVLAAAGGEYSFVDVSATCDDAPLAAAVAQSGLVSFVLLEQRHGGKEEAEAAVKTGSGADREAVPCMDSGDASQLEVDDDWE